MSEVFLNFIVFFSRLDWLMLCIPFIILILCGLGLPLPEDIILIFMGFLVYNGYGNLYFAIGLGYLGIIIGDAIIFSAGKKYGTKLLKIKPFSRLITFKRLKRAKAFIDNHGKKTLLIARFLPGLRAPIFFSCGTLKMNFSFFFLIDSIAALASAPIFILLGYFFGDKIDTTIAFIKRVDRLVILVIISAFLTVYLLKKISQRRNKEIFKNE